MLTLPPGYGLPLRRLGDLSLGLHGTCPHGSAHEHIISNKIINEGQETISHTTTEKKTKTDYIIVDKHFVFF